MDGEIILKQPADRRLTRDTNTLPPGPPGAEHDEEYIDDKKDGKVNRESLVHRRSPSGSPSPSKRKSLSKGSQRSTRRRTPSPRRRVCRTRNDYSPDRRRGNDRGRMRRSPVRNRSSGLNERRNGRDRFRGRRSSRSNSPIPRRRWSPKKKTLSPVNPATDYNVASSSLFTDAYSTYGHFGQPQQSYGHNDFVVAASQTTFAPGYPQPPAWGVPPESYHQQNWVTHPEPMPASIMQQPTGVLQTTLVQPLEAQPVQQAKTARNTIEANPTTDAVAQEAENQRDELKKQRSSYLKKTTALKKELKVLKDQRKELTGGSGSQSPTTKGFLDENERLQSQIQKKLSTIENVIDMLTGIIGEENLSKEDIIKSPKKPTKKKRSSPSSSSEDSSTSNSSSSSSSSSSSDSEENISSELSKSKEIESIKKKKDGTKALTKEKHLKDLAKKSDDKKVNYVFYDPETHWCKICNTFPKTAKDYLTHLHSKNHTEKVETMETPWHITMTPDEYPTYEGATIKRTPIRGLTFFVPSTSWFCKICCVWMGDLHCASLHLKSRTHSNKYNAFLEKNPNYEFDWLAERQKKLNETAQTTNSLITDCEIQKEEKHGGDKEKLSKKKKKKNSEKKDKKKKKRSKRRKKIQTSSSSNDSSSETDVVSINKTKVNLNKPTSGTAAPSIRVQMRNLQKDKEEMDIPEIAPPPPPKISKSSEPAITEIENSKRDDLISQWNIVQSVISDTEKKLFEQLKGKLKNKPSDAEKKEGNKDASQTPVAQFFKASEKVSNKKSELASNATKRDERKEKKESEVKITDRRRSRSRPLRQTKSRSLSSDRNRRIRSRSRADGMHRSRSWARRSSSRGRHPSRRYERRRRSRSRGRKRSRSHGRSRRRISSSRSRSRSGSNVRIEKAIVRQPEFRPRVPITDSNNLKKNRSKEEKEEFKKSSLKSLTSNKKLPFIGRMPVFKKQSQSSENAETFENYKKDSGELQFIERGPVGSEPIMHDSFNHAGYEPSLMSEYDDLMPDPVQFVSLMGAPPPPPSQPPPQQYTEVERDILPPGIDETESEFVPKPINDAPIPRKGPLPKDFEEALNIIFPDEKKSDNLVTSKPSGETQVIIDEPVMNQSDLLKDGIHMMTVEETSLACLDEASQISMNEPLQFNKAISTVSTTSSVDISSQSDCISNVSTGILSAIPPPPPPRIALEKNVEENSTQPNNDQNKLDINPRIQSPQNEIVTKISETEFDKSEKDQLLSPADSEKYRRQEELDDLAMLGIDTNDMAAMCI